MRIIAKKRLVEFWRKHPDARTPLEAWHEIVRAARWESLQDARRTFAHADAATTSTARTVTVFNIGGNKYRLLAAIHYNRGVVFVLEILTHAEYGRGNGRNDSDDPAPTYPNKGTAARSAPFTADPRR